MPIIKKGMIKVSVYYPRGEGKTFDIEYYVNKHIPLLERLMGDSLKMTAVEKGVTGKAPEESASYVAARHMYFETMAAFQHSIQLYGDTLMKDMPNYTTIQPVIQISEIMK